MPKALPEHVLPLRLAHKGEKLEGDVSLGRMSRLATLLHHAHGNTDESGAGSAHVELSFGYDDEGQARITGRVEARPVMICQRCLEPMPVEVACDVSLALVVEGTDTSKLDSGYEPLVVGESPQSLADLVEDEIMLALPSIARHQPDSCRMPAGADVEDDASAPHEQRRDNPFAVLKRLKND